jgi:hypothetical protein
MARTWHHSDNHSPHFPNGAPKWYRQNLNRLYRARVKHLVRTQRYERITRPVRDAAWYW